MIRFNIYRDGTLFFKEIVNELKSEPIYQPQLSKYLFYGLGFLKQIDFNLSNKFNNLIKNVIFPKIITDKSK